MPDAELSRVDTKRSSFQNFRFIRKSEVNSNKSQFDILESWSSSADKAILQGWVRETTSIALFECLFNSDRQYTYDISQSPEVVRQSKSYDIHLSLLMKLVRVAQLGPDFILIHDIYKVAQNMNLNILSAHACGEKVVVPCSPRHKPLMRAIKMLHDSSLIQNVDDIRFSNGAHPMRDGDGSTSTRNFLKSLLNEKFGLLIDGRRGFVKDVNRRVLDQRASDC